MEEGNAKQFEKSEEFQTRKQMELNEIKKTLYKTRPLAIFINASKKGLNYRARIESGVIDFLIPLDDIGDAFFLSNMPSQLLIRYIVN